jgi:hexulose-6-phosphate isomerase
MKESGRRRIKDLSEMYDNYIQSLTADCFMQMPFYKANGSLHERLYQDFENVIEASAMAGIKLVVVPLVDNGSIENDGQENLLFESIISVMPTLKAHNMFIAFESDFHPQALAKFINKYPSNVGINYDVGNSASMGFDPNVEFLEYGRRILNVHVKDRILGGGTVPLGHGDANLPYVFRELRKIGYSGNYILQTARALDGNHAAVLTKYKNMIEGWLS